MVAGVGDDHVLEIARVIDDEVVDDVPVIVEHERVLRLAELGDLVLLRAGADVDAHERLSALDGRLLREVHDIDRCLAAGQRQDAEIEALHEKQIRELVKE